jgi:hypothetical protein
MEQFSDLKSAVIRWEHVLENNSEIVLYQFLDTYVAMTRIPFATKWKIIDTHGLAPSPLICEYYGRLG